MPNLSEAFARLEQLEAGLGVAARQWYSARVVRGPVLDEILTVLAAIEEVARIQPGMGAPLLKWLSHREQQGLPLREPTLKELRALLPPPPAIA